MSRNRFEILLSVWNSSNNEDADTIDSLYKLTLLNGKLAEIFKTHYTHGKCLYRYLSEDFYLTVYQVYQE